jgi:hypothetical protein
MQARKPSLVPRKPAPRVAGRRLQVLAALLRSPITGNRLARLMLSQIGLGAFRSEEEGGTGHLRPAVIFRAAPLAPAAMDAEESTK